METNSSLFIETWIKQSVSEDFITVRTYKLLLYSLSQNCLPIENRHVPKAKDTPIWLK
jgi:hypothetical protein